MLNASINTPPAGPYAAAKAFPDVAELRRELQQAQQVRAAADAKRATWLGREARAGCRGVLRSQCSRWLASGPLISL
jgi:hypothetical protein